MTFENYCKEIARHRHAQGFKAENNPLRRGFLYDRVLHVVDAFLRQTKKKILILNLPQKGGKSLVVNYLTTYLLSGLNADCKILRVTNTEDNAIEHQQNINDIYNSEENRALFPHKPSKRFETKSELVLNGQYKKACKSYSVNSTIDGKRTNFIVIDDVYKNFAEAQSPSTTEKIMRFWKTSLYSRLENENSKVVIAGTRYTKSDFYARIVDEYSWGVFGIITVPAIINGESFCESVLPISELMRIKSSITEDEFNALYLQNPTAEGFINPFAGWKPTVAPLHENQFDFTCTVADPSFGVGGDFFTVGKFGYNRNGTAALLDLMLERVCSDQMYIDFIEKANCQKNYIEKNGVGGMLLNRICNITDAPLIPFTSIGNKLERIYMNANDIMKLTFNDSLIIPFEQFANFGKEAHDDLPDMLSHFFNNIKIYGN